ncbi:helix-turn-helix domain-containing protein [uncultured Desulfuromusa sp.]|uniref:helix-turn-helix domain-containing protein n=1 Tax=uncultured Desulfuromusa sp. TaxID=219183 RepID=UPI002AA8AAB0|nr:helix-turn-helix domain-containing protein [uncultured Desulfuromusa sp.]
MHKLENILNTPDTRNEWIKFQLALRRKSFASLGEKAGVSRQCVKSALNKSYPKMERLIADALDMPVEQLWPERYNFRFEDVVNG